MKQEELQRMYQAYFEPIYRFVYARVRHKQTTEDIVSDVFRLMCQHVRGFEPKHANAEKAWVYAIARNEVAAYYRKRADVDSLDNWQETLPEKRRHSPDDVIDLGMQLDAVMTAIDTLSDRKKEIVLLRYQSDLSNTEIAEMLGIDPKAVASQLSKAIKELRVLL